jgi:glycosyltransferase involved in cell wall biosynthesis
LQKRRTELFCRDLDRLKEMQGLGSNDVLLVNSLRHWSLGDVVEWTERQGESNAPMVALILHYTPEPQPGVPDPAARAYRHGFERIARSPLSSRIFLFTDSELLLDQYRSCFDVPIAVVPVPHCANKAVLPSDSSCFSIVFAGEARTDKGFDLLPEAIRLVMTSTEHPNIRFKIQAYRADVAPQGAHDTGFSEWEAVQVLTDPLGEAEYSALISEADLILLPYLQGPYRAQTSGVYCEAAALGIPVIVPSGTWMADQVAKFGGGVLFEAGNAASLGKACLEALANHRELRDEARRAAEAWGEFHNPSNFIACIEERLGAC